MFDKMHNLIPMCHVHSIRAELEIETYTRAYFENHWDTAVEDVVPTITCPLLTFLDGFGSFRTSYRSTMGMYSTPAGLPEEERRYVLMLPSYITFPNMSFRSRQANMFPIVFGPHGWNFSDVVGALRALRYLDEGMKAQINNVDYLTCVFKMCYLGDMPQQAENSGFKSSRAHKFCRLCFAGSETPDINDLSNMTGGNNILNIDTITHSNAEHDGPPHIKGCSS